MSDRKQANFDVYWDGATKYLKLPYHERRQDHLAAMMVDSVRYLNPGIRHIRFTDLGFGGSELWKKVKVAAAKYGISVEATVADINPLPVQQARADGVDHGVILDLDQPPHAQGIPLGSQHIVAACEVTEHVPDPSALLEQWAPLLTEQAVMGISTPNLAPVPERLRFGIAGMALRHTNLLHDYLYVHISTLTASGLREAVDNTRSLQLVTVNTQLTELPIPFTKHDSRDPLQLPGVVPSLGGSLLAILAPRSVDLDHYFDDTARIAGKRRYVPGPGHRHPVTRRDLAFSDLSAERSAAMMVNHWRALNPEGHVPTIAILGNKTDDLRDWLACCGAHVVHIPSEASLASVRDSALDGVAISSLLETTFDSLHLLKQCRRVMQPNGVLLSRVHELASLRNRLGFFAGRTPTEMRRGALPVGEAPIIRPWTASGLAAVMSAADLDTLGISSDCRSIGKLRTRRLAQHVPQIGDASIRVATPRRSVTNTTVNVRRADELTMQPVDPRHLPRNTPLADFQTFTDRAMRAMPGVLQDVCDRIVKRELPEGEDAYVHTYGYATFVLGDAQTPENQYAGTAVLHIFPDGKPLPRALENLTVPKIHVHRSHLFSTNFGREKVVDHLFHIDAGGQFDPSIPNIGTRIVTPAGEQRIAAARYCPRPGTGIIDRHLDLPVVYLEPSSTIRRANQGQSLAMPAGMGHATANSSTRRLNTTVVIFGGSETSFDAVFDTTGTFQPGEYSYDSLPSGFVDRMYPRLQPFVEDWKARSFQPTLIPPYQPAESGLELLGLQPSL